MMMDDDGWQEFTEILNDVIQSSLSEQSAKTVSQVIP
jgi:hypothetical protein